jgi:hypothetical protein
LEGGLCEEKEKTGVGLLDGYEGRDVRLENSDVGEEEEGQEDIDEGPDDEPLFSQLQRLLLVETYNQIQLLNLALEILLQWIQILTVALRFNRLVLKTPSATPLDLHQNIFVLLGLLNCSLDVVHLVHDVNPLNNEQVDDVVGEPSGKHRPVAFFTNLIEVALSYIQFYNGVGQSSQVDEQN